MFLHYVGVGRLRIFHQRAAAIAIDIDRHQTPVQPRHAQRAQKCVGDLLALKTAIIAWAIARLVQLVERRAYAPPEILQPPEPAYDPPCRTT